MDDNKTNHLKYCGNIPDENLNYEAEKLYKSGHTFKAAILVKKYTTMSLKQACRYVDSKFYKINP